MPPLPDGLPQLQNQINLSYSLFASASPSKFGQVVLRKTTFPDSTLRCTYLCEISGLAIGLVEGPGAFTRRSNYSGQRSRLKQPPNLSYIQPWCRQQPRPSDVGQNRALLVSEKGQG